MVKWFFLFKIYPFNNLAIYPSNHLDNFFTAVNLIDEQIYIAE